MAVSFRASGSTPSGFGLPVLPERNPGSSMIANLTTQLMPPEAYLEWEAQQPLKYEYLPTPNPYQPSTEINLLTLNVEAVLKT